VSIERVWELLSEDYAPLLEREKETRFSFQGKRITTSYQYKLPTILLQTYLSA